jgi:putative transcriptional regulator
MDSISDGSEKVDGRLLVASPALSDPNFFRAVVLILTHDDDGALGVVLNRSSDEPVEPHLPAWSDHLAYPPVVFVGGPVEPAVAIGLVRDADPVDPTALEGVGLVDLAAEPGPDPAGPIRVFSGYAGWGAGQLENELEEGAWFVLPGLPEDAFSDDPQALWPAVLRRQGGALAMLANFPEDPRLN